MNLIQKNIQILFLCSKVGHTSERNRDYSLPVFSSWSSQFSPPLRIVRSTLLVSLVPPEPLPGACTFSCSIHYFSPSSPLSKDLPAIAAPNQSRRLTSPPLPESVAGAGAGLP